MVTVSTPAPARAPRLGQGEADQAPQKVHGEE